MESKLKQEFLDIIEKNERIILKICNTYCKELAYREDLYQDIVIQLWKSFPKFKNKSSISTWMYRIALNTAISRYRKVSKRLGKEQLNEELVAIDSDESKHEEVKLLYNAIARLNPIEKAIIMLYLEELKYREIGDIMNLSESNVGFKINAIKKKLKQTLEENEN